MNNFNASIFNDNILTNYKSGKKCKCGAWLLGSAKSIYYGTYIEYVQLFMYYTNLWNNKGN